MHALMTTWDWARHVGEPPGNVDPCPTFLLAALSTCTTVQDTQKQHNKILTCVQVHKMHVTYSKIVHRSIHGNRDRSNSVNSIHK